MTPTRSYGPAALAVKDTVSTIVDIDCQTLRPQCPPISTTSDQRALGVQIKFVLEGAYQSQSHEWLCTRDVEVILVVDRRVDGWTSAPAAPVWWSVSNGTRADIQHLACRPTPCGVTLTVPRRRADATKMTVQGSRTEWWWRCMSRHRRARRHRGGGAALIASLQARQISSYAHLRTGCRSDTWRCCENSHQHMTNTNSITSLPAGGGGGGGGPAATMRRAINLACIELKCYVLPR